MTKVKQEPIPKPFAFRLFLETALLCFVSLGFGLFINHEIVSRGFDGSLIVKIKSHLEKQIKEKAQKPNLDKKTAKIIFIDVQQAKDLCDSGQAYFIDSRTSGAYRDGHIHGAINITDQNLDEHFLDLMDSIQQTKIVIYCSGVDCPQATELAELMVENDLWPIYIYNGGWERWEEMDYPACIGENHEYVRK